MTTEWVSFTIGMLAVGITLAVALVRYILTRHDDPPAGPDPDDTLPSARARAEAAKADTHNRIDRTIV
ncbi:hypothetical protein [Cryobacterium tepidiphilum]|jgi:hypothetical protein|uniref:Uncharacterized protein n=1 Tax=Cryobacterium tepidiphilum TaxID=2486026 RepID=A0A3M8LGB7_9MICO|nr:hypothetical protein [Cryobacterium tepidiphilum]RNE63772.1 hypothetical protein EEJ31_05945 [Cryobacterium tepidiphilum]